MTCPTCSNSIPSNARFCPKCGSAADGESSTAPAQRHDTRHGIPWAGLLFLLGVVFGPAAVISGAWWGFPVLLWAGVAVTVTIVLTVVLGMLF